jgi:hypothetical protein
MPAGAGAGAPVRFVISIQTFALTDGLAADICLSAIKLVPTGSWAVSEFFDE